MLHCASLCYMFEMLYTVSCVVYLFDLIYICLFCFVCEKYVKTRFQCSSIFKTIIFIPHAFMPNNPAPRWPKMAKVKDSILDHIGMLDPAGQHNLLAGKFIAGKLMTSS